MRTNLILAAAATAALTGSAFAADLPRRAAPPVYTPVAPVFTWTGFNFGLTTSYLFTDRQNVVTFGNQGNTQTNVGLARRAPVRSTEVDGFANVGGGFGYDYQFGAGSGVVVGFAADATWTDLRKRKGYVGPALAVNNFTPDVSRYTQTLDYLGTVRGRIGYAFDRFLVYGTGGFAYGGVDYRADFFRNTDGALAYTGRNRDTETGYVYGGGIEYAIPTDSILNRFNFLSLIGIQSQAVTLKAEYLHYDLGKRTVLVNNTGLGGAATGSYNSTFRTEGNLVRAGLTYRFGSLFGL